MNFKNACMLFSKHKQEIICFLLALLILLLVFGAIGFGAVWGYEKLMAL